ncbi:MAG: BMP family ABC transporter substrate-binding protein [Candidatus Heimdallarchaeota archaeon]|nr:BMP family ABC transporter substrate-binding protein [Candidatus Heimdallarchaeota archaeon]MDH5644978.1 BMP family ABC transporter substrate-binding protein [Candidatus Heimdallarchaeota archaeon]
MKKQTLTLFLTMLMIVSWLGMANSVSSVNINQTTMKVAIVYSTGGVGDQSFNAAALRGIQAAQATYGSNLEVVQACDVACDYPDITAAIESYGSDSTIDLVIGIGFSAGDGIIAASTANPSMKFMIIDSEVDAANVAAINFKEQEGSFLVGAMAGMVTSSKKLGFLGGLDIPLINRFGAGYEHGARYMDRDISVTVEYSPNPDNPWGDLDGGALVAESMIQSGIDIIYAAAGGTGIGVFNAVAEQNAAQTENQYYGIGVDSDQDHISPGNVLASMIKKVDVAVEGNIVDLMESTWSAGIVRLGLADNGVDISPMTYTPTEKNAEYNSTHTRWEVIEGLKQQIINGAITVAEDFSEVDSLLPAVPGASSSESDDGRIPYPAFYAFLSFIALVSIIRIKKRN